MRRVRVAVVLLVGIVLLAMGHGHPAEAQNACKNPPPTINWLALLAEPVPVWGAVLQLADTIEAQGLVVPGLSVAIVIDQNVVFAAGFGCATLPGHGAPPRPATPSTFYKIESVTKVFEATMLMQQRERQRGGPRAFSLTEPVSLLVPPVFFQVGTELSHLPYSPTYLQLATHTSGLPDQIPDGLATVEQYFEFIEHEIVPAGAVGVYSYSDEGFVALGQAVAIIADPARPSYKRYVSENIFRPLGMVGSTYDYTQIPASRRATPYKLVGSSFEPDSSGNLNKFPPDGDVWTNVLEMAKVVSLQFRTGPIAFGSQILACSSIQEMWEPVANAGGDGFSTIGWFNLSIDGFEVISKNGGNPFWSTLVRFLPNQRLGVIAFANVGTVASGLRELEDTIIGNLAPLLPSRRPVCIPWPPR